MLYEFRNLIVQLSKHYYLLVNVGIILNQNFYQNRPFLPFSQKLSARLDGFLIKTLQVAWTNQFPLYWITSHKTGEDVYPIILLMNIATMLEVVNYVWHDSKSSPLIN